jgi:hypothetical protein
MLRSWREAEKLARSYRSGDLTAVWVPDEGSEALRDLVRAREAAKQDQLRARHRLGKFLLRSGQRPPSGVRAWTHLHLIWVSQIRFTQAAQESTRLDYLHEVEHMRERVLRLEQAIVEAVKLASPALQEVITDLQALRGIAHISAVTIAAELGQVSRFAGARELMGYCGAVPSENSSGKRTRRGGITKTGNAHLRRIVCVYQFGGPADGVTDGLISPKNGRWITINLATELSFLAILSGLFISIFSSINRRSFAMLAALTTFSLSSLFVIVTTFWADPIANSRSHRKESDTSHLF